MKYVKIGSVVDASLVARQAVLSIAREYKLSLIEKRLEEIDDQNLWVVSRGDSFSVFTMSEFTSEYQPLSMYSGDQE